MGAHATGAAVSLAAAARAVPYHSVLDASEGGRKVKASIIGWVHLDTTVHLDQEPRFAFFGFQATSMGYAPIFEHSFEVELPANFSRVAVESEAIKAQMAQAAADYHATVQKLQERLSKLQAIEYTEEAL